MTTEKPETQPATIIELEAENVKRLKAARVRPDGTLVTIGGRNAQGKTSLLDCISYAMEGGKALAEVPLRTGEAKGFTRATLSSGLVVERTFTPNGSKLTVSSGEVRLPSPQAILDKLWNSVAADPFAFVKLKPAERLKALQRFVGLDFTQHDGKRLALYEKRTDVNRDAKRAEAQLGALPPLPAGWTPGAPEPDLGGLAKEVAAARSSQAALHAAERQATVALERLETARRDHALATRAMESARSSLRDPGPLEALLADAQTLQKAAAQAEQRNHLEEELAEMRADAEQLTSDLAAMDAEKAKLIRDCALKADGLEVTVGDTDVMVTGLPFAQASHAEQLRVACAMAMAANPTLRVLLIRDASLLDQDSRAALARQAGAGGFQLWLEVVGNQDCTAVIEDGEVVG